MVKISYKSLLDINSLHSVVGVSLFVSLTEEAEDDSIGLTVNYLLTTVLNDSGVDAELADDACRSLKV